MANIFEVEPPRWLQEIAKPIDTKATGQFLGLLLAGASQSLKSDKDNVDFTQGYNIARRTLQDPDWMLKRQKEEVAVATDVVRAESAWQMMDLKKQEQAAWLQDLPTIREQAGKSIEQQITEPLGAMRSRQGNALAMQMNRAASASAVAKSMNESKASYDKRVAEIIKQQPDIGTGLALGPTQFPRPNNWKALELAEQRVQLRKEIQTGQAELEAEARGDEVTTRIDEKGNVIKTYKPATGEVPFEERTLSDGTKIIRNPKTGHFQVLKGNQKSGEMTPAQLLSLAKTIRLKSPKDAKTITDFLTERATEQIGGKKSPTPAPAPPSAPTRESTITFENLLEWRKTR